MEMLCYTCVGGAAITFLMMCSFAKKRNGAKPGVICLILSMGFVAGAIALNNRSMEIDQQNYQVVSNSAYLNAIVGDLPYTLNEIAVEPHDDLRVKKPYLAVELSGTPLHVSAVKQYSNGAMFTEKDIQECKSIIFLFSDNWATAEYSTGSGKIVGTSERLRCYFYDVETGCVFDSGELKAKELPEHTRQNPHYYVSNESLKKWIESKMQ